MMARFAAVGAGRMGRGIAIAFAYAGHRIALVDLKPRAPTRPGRRCATRRAPRSAASLAGLAALGAMRRGASRRRSPSACELVDAERRAERACATPSWCSRACPRRMDAKRDAFEQLNRHVPRRRDPDVDHQQHPGDAARGAGAPARALPEHALAQPGLRDPGGRAEHASGHRAPTCWRARASSMESIGKLPVVCGAAPGYIVPRLQALVMNEAARMVRGGRGHRRGDRQGHALRHGPALRGASAWWSSSTSAAATSCITRAARWPARSMRPATPRRRSSSA